MRDETGPHGTTLKRLRSPNPSALGWAEYDADLVDNYRQTKRFAGASLAEELSATVSLAVAGISPTKTSRSTASGAEPMCISAGCSPAITPTVRAMETTSASLSSREGYSTPKRGHHVPQAAVPMERPTGGRMGALTAMEMLEHLPTSPSDPPQMEGQNLRKQTLMRIVLRRAGEDVQPQRASLLPSGNISDLPVGVARDEHAHEHSSLRREYGNEMDASPGPIRRLP